MIKIQIDLTDVSATELAEFLEIPGMKQAISALNTRGRELNVALTMTGGESAVASIMSDIASTLPPEFEYDEYHKIGAPVQPIFPMGMTRPHGKFDISTALAFEQLTNRVQLSRDEPPSLLAKLTCDQRQALDAWADEQVPAVGGSVDLMRWPGWAEALEANIETN